MSKIRPYVGPDRRSPVPPGEHPVGSRLVLASVVLAVTGWSVLIALSSPDLAGSLAQLSRSLAGALFLTAGGLRLATWRITGEAIAAWHAIGLMLLGMALCFISVLGVVEGEPSGVDAVPGRQLLMLVAIALLLIGAFGPDVQAGLRPARIALLVSGSTLALAVIIAARTSQRLPRELMLTMAHGAAWVVTVLWIWAGTHHLCRGRRHRRITEQWGGVGLAFVGLSELIRVGGIFGEQAWQLATGFHLIAAGILLAASATRFSEVLAASGSTTLRLAVDLDHVRNDLVTFERVQHQRLHDASTAVVGVIGASRLLLEPAPGGEIDPARLHRMMTAELDRLHAVLDPGHNDPTTAFDVAQVLDPLIVAHRIAGAAITVGFDRTTAYGRPAAFATAVANVLANARTHACGKPITVAAARNDDQLVLTISDQGPGIPPADRDLVLEHGVRGIRSPGSGIGLFTARAAMQRQGGTLRVEGTESGGTAVVLTLPVAGGSSAGAPNLPPQPERKPQRAGV